MNLSILYRGPLSSCNYACHYCPFAKHHESAEELAPDRHALERFVDWVESRRADAISVLFTPWGEALIRRWYQTGIARLSHMPNVKKVAIQTNLSCRLDWLDRCDKERTALWTTFHPGQTARHRFLDQCRQLDQRGVPYSVGVVGLKENEVEISRLRQELGSGVYLWINAYKDQPDYYDQVMIDRFTEIDPLFPINNQRHRSLGKACRTGRSVISVDGEGTIRRCHFIRKALGNIYEPGFEACLQERPCQNARCGCHIGYVHLDYLNLASVFGEGILERVPSTNLRAGDYVPGLRAQAPAASVLR
ncbi:MAG TPA: STM4011 family radical SAM protein [Candidatus Dormibacteraeota bacterium]|nr:STM4011 family radical SAM protein [Candidatus Dormibacteraeota bacterium]